MEQRWKVLTITSIGLFMASLDLFIVNIAFPDLARDFNGASLPSLSWVLNAYAIVFAALLVPAGRIADRVGRKRVFIAGLLLFSAASALCALAPSVPFLVGARVLQAAGGAMMLPTTLGLILPAFPLAQRPLAIGIWSAVGGVAAALGPPIGGLLVQLSWRWIFVVNVPIGVITAIVAWRALQEVREPEDGRPDLLGAAELALGIGLLTLGIVKGPEWGWADPRALASFAAAVALVVAFVIRSGRHEAPVIELPLLRVRSFALANLAAMVFFAGFGAMLLSGVLLLTEVWGYSALKAGLALSPGPLTAAIFAIPSGRLGGRIGQRPVAAAGGLTFATGFAVILATVGSEPAYASSFLPGFVLGGAGVGMVLGTLPAAATAALPASRFATGTAVFGMARQLGSAIGVAVLIALLNDSTGGDLLAGLQRGWAFALGAGLGTAALALAFGPVTRPAAQPPPEPAPQPNTELAAQGGVT
ncbi:MAG TPA: DHA2 family efflux MFS transporter permease subunit [Solirubrobacterales bacterium]|jgi:EmrB/QacA subfamily drug resistance transporter|nr:DHA2 family efflux MFS transporter permease subunit [Solirubrobacterales bacterium]